MFRRKLAAIAMIAMAFAPASVAQGADQVIVMSSPRSGGPPPPSRDNCSLPKPSDAAQIVVLGVMEPQAISSVAIGPQEAAIYTAEIRIAEGPEPLYLVVTSSHSTIWRFTGATERIERAVLHGGTTGVNVAEPNVSTLAGATGLPAAKVTFPFSHCFFTFHMGYNGWDKVVADLTGYLGRKPHVVAGLAFATVIHAPYGEAEWLPRRPRDIRTVRPNRSALESTFQVFRPGGLVMIDPAQVVGSRPAATYEVYPQEAGLLQLVASGALEAIGSRAFIVHRKTRYPARLAGGHSVTFHVPDDVPLPDGDPAHSTVCDKSKRSAGATVCRWPASASRPAAR